MSQIIHTNKLKFCGRNINFTYFYFRLERLHWKNWSMLITKERSISGRLEKRISFWDFLNTFMNLKKKEKKFLIYFAELWQCKLNRNSDCNIIIFLILILSGNIVVRTNIVLKFIQWDLISSVKLIMAILYSGMRPWLAF